MFPLRMTHPKHGATYAHDNHEAERLKKLGWVEEEKTALGAVLEGFRQTKKRKAA